MGRESDAPLRSSRDYELRFGNLAADAADLAFPCDAAGRVDLDALDDRHRSDYLFAHMLVGHDFAVPVVCRR